jgi:hypothetical protein
MSASRSGRYRNVSLESDALFTELSEHSFRYQAFVAAMMNFRYGLDGPGIESRRGTRLNLPWGLQRLV